MISKDAMDQWKVNAGFIVLEIELFDAEWRDKNKDHECNTKNMCSDGSWYCKHLTSARKKNKRILELKKAFVIESPYVHDSYFLSEMVEARYNFNNL